MADACTVAPDGKHPHACAHTRALASLRLSSSSEFIKRASPHCIVQGARLRLRRGTAATHQVRASIAHSAHPSASDHSPQTNGHTQGQDLRGTLFTYDLYRVCSDSLVHAPIADCARCRGATLLALQFQQSCARRQPSMFLTFWTLALQMNAGFMTSMCHGICYRSCMCRAHQLYPQPRPLWMALLEHVQVCRTLSSCHGFDW
jgi:hypothetical protein